VLLASLLDGSSVRLPITESGLTIGREPGPEGLVVDADDQTISSTALKVTSGPGGVRIENCSSFATLEITNERGLRLLFPGESLLVAGNATVALAGETYTHKFDIHQVTQDLEVVAPTGTRQLAGSDVVISGERRLVLSAMCLARFFPERFGAALLSARDISNLLARSGIRVTPRAVNNKIQRVREQLSSRNGVYLDTREDLADFVIRRGLITVEDARGVLEKSSDLSAPERSSE
jgi:hypothetical protein